MLLRINEKYLWFPYKTNNGVIWNKSWKLTNYFDKYLNKMLSYYRLNFSKSQNILNILSSTNIFRKYLVSGGSFKYLCPIVNCF